MALRWNNKIELEAIPTSPSDLYLFKDGVLDIKENKVQPFDPKYYFFNYFPFCVPKSILQTDLIKHRRCSFGIKDVCPNIHSWLLFISQNNKLKYQFQIFYAKQVIHKINNFQFFRKLQAQGELVNLLIKISLQLRQE